MGKLSSSLLSLHQYQSLPDFKEPTRNPSFVCRLVRLCLCALLIPLTLISIPLFYRNQILVDTKYDLMASDIRSVQGGVSTVWCQAQSLRMNGTFDGFLFSSKPSMRTQRRPMYLRRHIRLSDDMKEFWGFYLLRGSTIRLSSCARWPGAGLVVVRGATNLRRCAFIGQEDSMEDETSEEAEGEQKYLGTDGYFQRGVSRYQPVQAHETEHDGAGLSIDAGSTTTNVTGRTDYQTAKRESEASGNRFWNKIETHASKRAIQNDRKTRRDGKEKEIWNTASLGGADPERDPEEDVDPEEARNTASEEGMYYDFHDLFNQTRRGDESFGEFHSSFSSSEEALANCEGVLVNVEVHPGPSCDSFDGAEKNALIMDAKSDGRYYFLFSNENEVFDNDFYLSFEIERVVYDISRATNICSNTSYCRFRLSFWSDEVAVIDVVSGQNATTEAGTHFILESSCEVRVPMFLSFIIAAPVLFLLCAFS